MKCEVQKLNWRLLFTSIGLKGHIYNNKKSCETQPGTGNWFKREIFAILSQGNTGNPRPYPQKIPSYKKSCGTWHQTRRGFIFWLCEKKVLLKLFLSEIQFFCFLGSVFFGKILFSKDWLLWFFLEKKNFCLPTVLVSQRKKKWNHEIYFSHERIDLQPFTTGDFHNFLFVPHTWYIFLQSSKTSIIQRP